MAVLAGVYLRRLRKEAGYTLQEVSAQTGIGEGYLSKLETGQVPIGPKSAMLLASFYDVPVEKLWRPRRREHRMPKAMKRLGQAERN